VLKKWGEDAAHRAEEKGRKNHNVVPWHQGDGKREGKGSQDTAE